MVSMNGTLFEAAKLEAEKRGMTMSHFVTVALKAQMPNFRLKFQHHSPDVVKRMRAVRDTRRSVFAAR